MACGIFWSFGAELRHLKNVHLVWKIRPSAQEVYSEGFAVVVQPQRGFLP